MLRLAPLLILASAMFACGKSAEQKLQDVQAEKIDAQAEAEKTQRDLEQELVDKRQELTETQQHFSRQLEESRERLDDAAAHEAEVLEEIAENKADAERKLDGWLTRLQQRVTELEGRTLPEDPVELTAHQQKLELVRANLIDAQTKVVEFRKVPTAEWEGAFETAKNSLARLEDSINDV